MTTQLRAIRVAPHPPEYHNDDGEDGDGNDLFTRSSRPGPSDDDDDNKDSDDDEEYDNNDECLPPTWECSVS